jgi:hypothetical protein
MKKITIAKLSAITLSVAILGGCATYYDLITPDVEPYSVNVTGQTYNSIEPGTVKLVYASQPNPDAPCKKYNMIGQIKVLSADKLGHQISAAQMAMYFQQAAAKYGADAVINITPGGGGFSSNETGYAIKCQN